MSEPTVQNKVDASCSKRFRWGILARKEKWVLTLKGKILAALLTAAIGTFFVRGLHPFLAVNAPVFGELLIIEGWLPDYGFEETKKIFNEGGYGQIITTGGPLSQGSYLSEFKSYAELARATLIRLGIEPSNVIALPAPLVRKDRTFSSAQQLRNWLDVNQENFKAIDIVTLDAHARRSRLLFQKALGGNIRVGIRSVENRDYLPEAWWMSSAGVRTVMSETIAYLYARVFVFFVQQQT